LTFQTVGVPCEIKHKELAMTMGSPETWRLLWVLAAGVFVVAEMARRLRLWFLPFAVGAGAAAATAWLGLALPVEWTVFAVVSAMTLLLLRPLARRLAILSPLAKCGSSRWTGREAVVEVAIPAVGDGWVRLGRERWRAENGLGLHLDAAHGEIPAGSTVLVTGVSGTHLIVLPLELGDGLPLYQPTSGRLPEQGV
jgi:membrane protein implicated in regulation of membrane protease activity